MATPGQAGIRRGREVTGHHDAGGKTTRRDPASEANALGIVRPEWRPI